VAGSPWVQPAFVVFLVVRVVVGSLVGLFPVAVVWCGLVRVCYCCSLGLFPTVARMLMGRGYFFVGSGHVLLLFALVVGAFLLWW
jgi:hypothetical protein